MHKIGWSTGAILPKGDKDNFLLAIELLKDLPFSCIEFGVMREHELPVFLECLPDLDVSSFDRVSFHCCKPEHLSDREIFDKIKPVIEKGWPIINHPDKLHSDCWKDLGKQLFIENMENRKPTGRTVEEMEKIFEAYPDAYMCFDIGHAKQVDPTMQLGIDLCKKFIGKIQEIHLSDVDPVNCAHRPIGHKCLGQFEKVSDVLPWVPIILECSPSIGILSEVNYIQRVFPNYGLAIY